MTVTIAELVRALDERVPFAWAEPWDKVGLLAGASDLAVTKVLVSLDQTRESVARAVTHGANVLVTHHPAFRDPPERVAAGPGAAGVVFAAIDSHVALVAAHTNLDRDPVGADALPAKLGLTPYAPLEADSQPCAHITVFCPPEAADAVALAMQTAGAGRVGRYADCAFSAPGEGRFRGLEGTSPAVGAAGEAKRAAEVRLETVCPRPAAGRVMEAAASAHPYEEPLILSEDSEMRRGAARMGRLCRVKDPSTLDALAALVGERLGVHPRVWGDPTAPVGTVAVATGSAASMVPHALAGAADVLVCGELRYHDALDAVSAGLAVIEAGHDATEWPLVPVLAEAVRTTPGLSGNDVIVDEPRVSWHVV